MKLDKQNENEIIKKLNDLFVTYRKKYIVMNDKGKYTTFDTFKHEKVKDFNNGHLWQHLHNKKTVGVFSGQYITKFITFDVDIIDKLEAKWTVYKLVDSLIHIGIPYNKIYISTSGNKGYHIDLYFSEPIKNEYAKEIYDITMNITDLSQVKTGKVEYRPTSTQGVKLPLGINFKNKDKNTCWYVDFNNKLKPIKNYEYILEIEKIDIDLIYNVIEKYSNIIIDKSIQLNKAEEVENTKGFIDSKYNSLDIYKKNMDHNYTIEYYQKLEQDGLKQIGTRHNSLFGLCGYYKYLGMTIEENEDALINWMNEQDIRTYTTSLKECHRDIKEIVKYIYDNDISLTIEHKDIFVTYDEMLEILKLKSKNEKLVTYCMLIHSKRFANKEDVFYMSFPQLSTASGLGLTTVKRIVPKLNEYGIIEYIEKNKIIKSNKKDLIRKAPNKYKVLINTCNENDNTYLIEINNDNTFTNSFNNCLISMFELPELKQMLPDRHYREVYKYTHTE